MPILNDILDHDLLGPAILKGRKKGRQEGRQEIIRRQIESRFAPVPAWIDARLAKLSAADLDDLAVRLLDATRLDEIFPTVGRILK